MRLADYLSTLKAQDEAANAAKYTEATLNHHNAVELTPIGGGWFVRPNDRGWRRIEYGGGIERHAVFYRPVGDGFLVSDRGMGADQLRIRNNLAADDSRLMAVQSSLAREFPDFRPEGLALVTGPVAGERLGATICLALRATSRLANRSL